MERKNYSFYMPSDFTEKLKSIQERDDKLKALSLSQAVYFVISQIAQDGKYSVESTEQSC